MNNKKLEIFEADFGGIFKVILTVEFTKLDNHYVVESKKFKLSLESTTNKIEDAREEFSDVFNEVTKDLINRQSFFHVLSYLGFENRKYSEVMNEKAKEILNFNKKGCASSGTVEIDSDKLMTETFNSINRIDPILRWEQSAC